MEIFRRFETKDEILGAAIDRYVEHLNQGGDALAQNTRLAALQNVPAKTLEMPSAQTDTRL